MKPKSLKGYLLAALAAATYGTNPAFAVPLYAEGMNPNSVLIFRYGLGMVMLAAMAAVRGRSLRLRRGEAAPLAVLGVQMALSSLCLFEAYNYMNSGVASTLLFVYPVMVAVLMVFFYHERFTSTTGVCLLLMLAGLGLLMRGGGEVSAFGICLVMLSSLTYALYLVMVNVSRTIRSIPPSSCSSTCCCSGAACLPSPCARARRSRCRRRRRRGSICLAWRFSRRCCRSSSPLAPFSLWAPHPRPSSAPSSHSPPCCSVW